jgi:SAM-dependent methyltransferase
MTTTPVPWLLPSSGDRLNLGCQTDYRDGWLNHDRHDAGDVVFDLETPWPLVEESFDFILASHVLEHIHDATHFMSEAWRVLRLGGTLVVLVPGVQDSFWNDPTHVRPYTTTSFELYSTILGPFAIYGYPAFTTCETIETEQYIPGHGLVKVVNARLVK